MENTQSTIIIPPSELVHSEHPKDLQVYLIAAEYALREGTDGHFDLPASETMQSVCHCSIHTLNASYKRLEEAGWLKHLNKDQQGPTRRKFCVIKLLEPTIGLKTVYREGAIKESLNVKPDGKGGTTSLHKVYNQKKSSFPTDLKLSCSKNRDTQGRALADIPDNELLRASGYASVEAIAFALVETDTYIPKEGETRNIIAAYSARFVRPKGKPGRLKPNRNKTVWQGKVDARHIASLQKYVPSQPADLNGVRFYPMPDAGFSAGDIDAVCEGLSEYAWVEEGALPYKLLIQVKPLLDENETEKLVRLKDSYRIQRVKCGYWKLIPIEVKKVLRARQSEMTTIADSLRAFAK